MAALAAGSAAKPFELVFNGEYEFDDDGACCGAGSLHLEGAVLRVRVRRRRGSRLVASPARTAAAASRSIYGGPPLARARIDGDGDWRILEGTGQYADLRGRGTSRGEMLSDDPVRRSAAARTRGSWTQTRWRRQSASRPKAFKVKGKKGVYTIPVALEIRDDVEGNPVAYKVAVSARAAPDHGWPRSRARRSEVSPSSSRSPPQEPVRAVLIRTTAVDPVGNESALDAW